MTEQRLEFGPSISGLLIDTLGSEVTPELKASLRAEGLDLDRPLLPAYPAALYVKCLRIVARALWPTETEDDALRHFGGHAVEGLNSNFLGRALVTLMRVIGLRRAVLRLDRAFRNSNNYTKVDVRELTLTSVEFIFNTVMGTPTYFEGVFLTMVPILGGREPRVEHGPLEGERHRYVLSWTA